MLLFGQIISGSVRVDEDEVVTIDTIIEQYTSGRIFNEQLELRWEQQGTYTRVIYLGTDLYASVLRDYKFVPGDKLLKSLSVQDKSYYLFGQRLRPGDVEAIGLPAEYGDFAEARIPRLLRYPVPYDLEKARKNEAEEKKDSKKRVREYVKLSAKEFFNEQGEMAFFRFVNLIPEEIKG